MSSNKVDYSELVEVLQKGDDVRAKNLVSEIVGRLEDYLCVVMNATPTDANECVQQAFVDVFDQVRQNNINEPKYFFSYLIKSCRNEYVRYMKRQHKFKYDEEALNTRVQPEQQFQNLLDKERQFILEKCLEELQGDSKEFIIYFIDKPDAPSEEVGNKFGLSESNVRTKKHRILGRLHHCFKRKSNQ